LNEITQWQQAQGAKEIVDINPDYNPESIGWDSWAIAYESISKTKIQRRLAN